MPIKLDEDAFKTAARDMAELKARNDRLKQRLERMYNDLTTALDSEAGSAVKWAGENELLEPVERMSKVLEHVSDTLNIIIGQDGRSQSEPKGVYYDKIFKEYEELDRVLKNKITK